jgi:hypothetical protein
MWKYLLHIKINPAGKVNIMHTKTVQTFEVMSTSLREKVYICGKNKYKQIINLYKHQFPVLFATRTFERNYTSEVFPELFI